MKKSLPLLIASTLLSVSAIAQTGSIRGTVLDADSSLITCGDRLAIVF